MLNPTSSPEWSAPSRGPPAWVEPQVDAGAARPPYCVTRCTRLVSGRRWCTVMVDETRRGGKRGRRHRGSSRCGKRDDGQARQRARWIVVLHAVVDETRGKQADLPQE